MSNSDNISKLLRDLKLANYYNVYGKDESLNILAGSKIEVGKIKFNSKSKNLSDISKAIMSMTDESLYAKELINRFGSIFGIGDHIKITFTNIDKGLTISDYKILGKDTSVTFDKVISNTRQLYDSGKAIEGNTSFLVNYELEGNNSDLFEKASGEKNKSIGYLKVPRKAPEPYRIEECLFSEDDAYIASDDITEAKKYKYLDKRNDKDVNRLPKFFKSCLQINNKIESNSVKNTRLAVIQILNPLLNISNRQTDELAVFLNGISSIEASRCFPHIDLIMTFPDNDVNFNSTNLFDFLTDSSDLKQIRLTADASPATPGGGGAAESAAKEEVVISRDAGMDVFTSPQTLVNANERYTGEAEYADADTSSNPIKRKTTIQDKFRPYLTLKSLDINIAPTKGIMSYKTGKLSLTLHDRSRLPDIASFINPDLYGVSGANLNLEYGWSHPDGKSNLNYRGYSPVGKFIDNTKSSEVYMITNSSFNMDEVGQVNIDLSIAMMGSIDLQINEVIFKSDFAKDVGGARKELKKLISAMNSDESGIGQLANLSIGYASAKKDFDEAVKGLKATPGTEIPEDIKDPDFDLSVDLENILKGGNAAAYESYVKEKRNYSQIKSLFDETSSISLVDVARSFQDGVTKAEISIWKKFVKQKNVILKDKEVKRHRGKFNNFINELNKLVKKLEKQENKFDKLLATFFSPIKNDYDPFLDPKVFVKLNLKKKEKLNNYKGYVSFGKVMLIIAGKRLADLQKYTEVQFVFSDLNSVCGQASGVNIASIPLSKTTLISFISDSLKKSPLITIEILLERIFKRFVSNKASYLYGLEEIYEFDNEVGKAKIRSKIKDVKSKLSEILQGHYYQENLIDNNDNSVSASITETLNKTRPAPFHLPSLTISVETRLKDKKKNEKILRVHFFDKQANNYAGSAGVLRSMEKSNLNVVDFSLNHLRQDLKTGLINGSDYHSSVYSMLNILKNPDEQKKLGMPGILKLEKITGSKEKFKLKYLPGSGPVQGRSFKDFYKRMMPSIKYGSHNSAVINAQVTTINEAKLATVFITRPKRNDTNKPDNVIADIPMRVMPTQVDVEMLGCPIVNYMQTIYIDFGTGTTIDNVYSVTSISHSISQGKFTTRLKLTYSDAYGKYESSTANINEAIARIEGRRKDIATHADAIKNSKKFKIIHRLSKGYVVFETVDGEDKFVAGSRSNIKKAIQAKILKDKEFADNFKPSAVTSVPKLFNTIKLVSEKIASSSNTSDFNRDDILSKFSSSSLPPSPFLELTKEKFKLYKNYNYSLSDDKQPSLLLNLVKSDESSESTYKTEVLLKEILFLSEIKLSIVLTKKNDPTPKESVINIPFTDKIKTSVVSNKKPESTTSITININKYSVRQVFDEIKEIISEKIESKVENGDTLHFFADTSQIDQVRISYQKVTLKKDRRNRISTASRNSVINNFFKASLGRKKSTRDSKKFKTVQTLIDVIIKSYTSEKT